jgi:hypothetical protein
MRFQRRSPAGPRVKPNLDAERKRQAEELAARSGIPLQMAYSVVDGHTTLDAVLKTMLAREKTRRLVEQHGLPPSLAGQVARGQVPLDRVLARHRRRTSEFWRAQFSVFDTLPEAPGPVAISCFGQDWLEGRVASVGKYDFVFDTGGGEQTLQKHDLKMLVHTPEALAAVREALSQDPAVRARGLGSTADLAERLRLDKERFYEEIKEGRALRFVFRDGDVLSGPVAWFSRYELGVRLSEAHEVTGFFHALLEWSPVPEKVAAQAGKKDAASGKSEAPKGKAHKKHKKGRR